MHLNPAGPIPASADARPSRSPGSPRLRLVAAHEHSWCLRSVEYDDAFEVRRYECAGCDDVQFR